MNGGRKHEESDSRSQTQDKGASRWMCAGNPDHQWTTSREERMFVGWVDADRSSVSKVDTPFMSFRKKYSTRPTSRGTLPGYK